MRSLTALGVLLLLAGCSVPSQSSAERVDGADVPFALLEDATTTTVAPPAGGPETDVIFLVRDDRLEGVERSEAAGDAPTLLTLLAAGPTDVEIAAGIRTALLPDLARISASRADVVTVDLGVEFSGLTPTEQRLALAQITYTLTQLLAVSAVEFLVDGERASVPLGDGSSVDRPVTAADYAELRPL